ncbi:hypothetical protein AAOGI_11660 [Agarivorans albus]
MLKNRWVKGVSAILVTLYLYSMIVQPLYISGLDGLMTTWKEWQTFNAGMIAILAAIISAYVALSLDKSARQRETVRALEFRQNEREKLRAQKREIDEQRHRELIAACAFLPASLSSVHQYVEDVSKKLLTLYTVRVKKEDCDLRKYVEEVQAPHVPDGYQGVFKDCITLSPPDVSEHLVYILVHLQVFSSRIASLDPEHLGYSYPEEMLIDSIRFQLKIESLFDFARKGAEVTEFHRNVDSYYSRIARLLDYQVQLERGNDDRIDKFIDSAVRRD